MLIQRETRGFSYLTKTKSNAMKKNTVNFWIDLIILFDFICVISTGLLLHRFPYRLSGRTVLGLSRYSWGNIHWSFSFILIIFIIIHLVLHWNWAKVSFKKYLSIDPKTLVIIVTVIFILLGILVPGYLTKDFPDKKDIYPKTGSLEVEKNQ